MLEAELIRHITQDPEEVMLLRSLLDKAHQAERGSAAASRFLSSREQMLSRQLMTGLKADNWTLYGGYEGAERCIFQCWPEWDEQDRSGVEALRLTYPPEGLVDHRTVLGSLMALGIHRDCIGDILVSHQSTDVLVVPEQAAYIAQSLTRLGRSRVTIRQIPLEDLHIPEQQTKTLRDTVASLRLDAVLAAGLNLSRDKASQLIRTGAVQVDHTDCQKPDRSLEPGALISVRGYGRLKLSSVGETTRKGRLPIVILRYL